MDLPSSDVLLELAKFAWVAIPLGALATRAERPRDTDRRSLLVILAAASACIVVGWPLATLMGVETMFGYALTLVGVASVAGFGMLNQLYRDPELANPEFVAKFVMLSFGAVAVAGLSWIAADILDLGLVVLVPALCGIGLGALYLARVRRQRRKQP